MFHVQNGLYFDRLAGIIRVIVAPGPQPDLDKGVFCNVKVDETFEIGVLASVMATMSKRGETAETWREALAYFAKESMPERTEKA